MFNGLTQIMNKPKPFEFYTTDILWNDDHISKQMLKYHLNPDVGLASRTSAFINGSVKWMAEYFNINTKTKICDFGCGPGLYTTRFAGLGAEVTGIDFSERSISYAKKEVENKSLTIDYHYEDYLKYETDKTFDLITMIFCDFCVLNPAQRKLLLDKFYKLLKKEGYILLDVITLDHFENTKETNEFNLTKEEGFWSAEPYFEFLNTFKYKEEKLLLNKHTIIEKSRSRIIYNWLQCFDQDSIQSEFENSGLTVCTYFSDVAGTEYDDQAPQMAIVAKRVE